MFSFLSPRLWMLIGLGVALLAAFLAGVKVESNRRDAALLAQQQKYQKEVDALREKERLVQEQTAKALEEERNKNQALSAQIQQAMKQVESRGPTIQVRTKCPAPAPARLVVATTHHLYRQTYRFVRFELGCDNKTADVRGIIEYAWRACS